MKKVLFICTHNSARSQLAEGLTNHLLKGKWFAQSAGTVATFVKPHAIKVMKEIGIDISHQYSKIIEEFMDDEFDLVVTVCDNANESCPFFPGKKIIHHSFIDPSNYGNSEDEKMKAFRKTREEIKKWIEQNLT